MTTFNLTENERTRGWHQGQVVWWTEFPKWDAQASMSYYSVALATVTLKYISFEDTAGSTDPYFRLKELEGPAFGVLPPPVQPLDSFKQEVPRTWHTDVYYTRIREAFQSNLPNPDESLSPYFLLGYVFPNKTEMKEPNATQVGFTMNNPPLLRDPHPPSVNFLDYRVWS